MSKRVREEDVIGAGVLRLRRVRRLPMALMLLSRADLTGGAGDVDAAAGRRVRLRVRALKPQSDALLGAEDDSPAAADDDDGDPDADVSDGDSDGDDDGSDFEPEKGGVVAAAAPRARQAAAPSTKKAPAKGAKKPREGVLTACFIMRDTSWVTHAHRAALGQGQQLPRLQGVLEPRSSVPSSCLTTTTTWKRKWRCLRVRTCVWGSRVRGRTTSVGADNRNSGRRRRRRRRRLRGLRLLGHGVEGGPLKPVCVCALVE